MSDDDPNDTAVSSTSSTAHEKQKSGTPNNADDGNGSGSDIDINDRGGVIASTTSTSTNSSHQHTEIKVPSRSRSAMVATNNITINNNNNDNNNNNNTSIRKQIGSHITTITNVINDNLIVVRYATFSTVLLLGVYGISNTPLFYRYKNVMDIPTKMFANRKWIHGRIVGVIENVSERSVGGSSSSSASARVVGGGGTGTTMVSSASSSTSSSTSSDWGDDVSSSASSSSSPSPSSNNTFKQSNNHKGLASLISSSVRRATGVHDDDGSKSSNTSNKTNTINLDIQQQHPIMVLFRHSSPMERLLTQSAMDKVLSFTGGGGVGASLHSSSSSSRLLYSSSDGTANPYRNLLQIELAGIVAPPPPSSLHPSQRSSSSILSSSLTDTTSSSLSSPTTANQYQILHQLIEQKIKVSLQLLAHRSSSSSSSTAINNQNETSPIVCHLHYRQPKQWFFAKTANASLEMVRKGQAWINSCGMVVPPLSSNNTTTDDDDDDDNTTSTTTDFFDPTVKQLRNDAQFMSRLEEAEYTSWKSKVGMWSSEEWESLRREYVEEEENMKNGWSTSSVWGWMKRSWDRYSK